MKLPVKFVCPVFATFCRVFFSEGGFKIKITFMPLLSQRYSTSHPLWTIITITSVHFPVYQLKICYKCQKIMEACLVHPLIFETVEFSLCWRWTTCVKQVFDIFRQIPCVFPVMKKEHPNYLPWPPCQWIKYIDVQFWLILEQEFILISNLIIFSAIYCFFHIPLSPTTQENKNSYQNCVAPYPIMWFNLPVTLL